MTVSDLQVRLEFARRVAREAGQLTLRYFQDDNLKVDLKSDSSPVTIADRSAEQLLCERIADLYAADGVLGEEFGETKGNSGYRWIVDPIDGTKSFIRGVPLYGTLVGLEHDGQCVLGVIYMPALDECAYAAVGHGAWHEVAGRPTRPARVSRVGRLADSLMCASDVASFGQEGRGATWNRLLASVRLCRTWGDCYGYLLVATGRAEVMVDPLMNPWDAAAVAPIVREAGGTFTDWQGEATIHGGNGVATNGRVFEQVMAITKAEGGRRKAGGGGAASSASPPAV